jgi:non-ribosomal peptide synthetase component E (peptide arylation enzyme)
MSATHEHRPDPADAARYRAAGWWGNDTIASVVTRHAATTPDALAYIADGRRYTWAEYEADSDHIARVLLAGDHRSGDRIAVMMPDGPEIGRASCRERVSTWG